MRNPVKLNFADHPGNGEVTHRRQCHIHLHRTLFDNPLFLTVLRDQANACPNRGTYVVITHRLAINKHVTAAAFINTGNQFHQFRTPGADQTRNTEHLTRTDGETGIANSATTREILNAKNFTIGHI